MSLSRRSGNRLLQFFEEITARQVKFGRYINMKLLVDRCKKSMIKEMGLWNPK
jgi:hypothetical protein